MSSRFVATLDDVVAPTTPKAAGKKGRFVATLDDVAATPTAPAPESEEPDFASRMVDGAMAVQDAFMPAGWRDTVSGVLKKAEDATTKARDYVGVKDPAQIPLVGSIFKPFTALNVGLPETIRTLREGVEATKRPSVAIRSFVRGGEQGLTGGYADEVLGAIDSLIGDDGYDAARDTWRERFAKSEAESHGAFETGHMTGSTYRDASLGKALGIVGPFRNLIYGGATGALEGSGNSEADVSNEPGRLALDTGVGAATNAAFSALGPQSIEPMREKIGRNLGAKADASVAQVVKDLTSQKTATEGELGETQTRRKALFDSLLDRTKTQKARVDEKVSDLGEDRARIVTERADAEHAKRAREAAREKAAAAKREAEIEAAITKERQKRTGSAVKEIEGTVKDQARKEQKRSLLSGKAQELLDRIEQEKARELRVRVENEAKAAAGQKAKLSAKDRKLAELDAEEAKIPDSAAAKRAQMFGEAGNRISRHEELVGPLPEELQPVRQKIVDSYRNNSAEHIRDPDVVAAEYEAGLRQKIATAREAILREADEAGGGLAGQADPVSVLGEERVAQIAKELKIPPERIPEMLQAPEAVSRVPDLESQLARIQSELAAVDQPAANPLEAVDSDLAHSILRKHGLDKTYPGPGRKMNIAALLDEGNAPGLSEDAVAAIRAARTPKPTVESDYGPFDEATAGEMTGRKGKVSIEGDPRIARILRRETRLRDTSQKLGDTLENPESLNANPRIAKLLGREGELAAQAKDLEARAGDRPGMLERGRTQLRVAASNKLADSPLKTVAGLGTPAAGAAWKVATERVPDGSFKNPEARAAFFDYFANKIGTDATLAKQYGAFIATAAARHDLNDLLQALYYVDTDPKLAAALGGAPGGAPAGRR